MSRELQISDGAQQVLATILGLFNEPEKLPAKMARVFLQVGERYCDRWSVRNQLIVAIMGAQDAATAKTWRQRGRWVTEHAYRHGGFNILRPLVRSFTVKETDDQGKEVERRVSFLYGFAAWHVHAIEETEVRDAELAKRFESAPEETQKFLSALPWLELAKSWGLSVSPAASSWFLGSYSPDDHTIQLCTTSVAVWAHELIHAAEDKLGRITKKGQDPDQEIVAELGAQVLLTCAGLQSEVDLRSCWEYLRKYSEGEDAAVRAYRLTGRVVDAVEHVLRQSGQRQEVRDEQAA